MLKENRSFFINIEVLNIWLQKIEPLLSFITTIFKSSSVMSVFKLKL